MFVVLCLRRLFLVCQVCYGRNTRPPVHVLSSDAAVSRLEAISPCGCDYPSSDKS